MHVGRHQVLGVCLIVLTLAVTAAGPLRAQADTAGTAIITGTVVDQSGTTIPQAAVAVKNETSGAVRSTTTETDGRFTVGNLRPEYIPWTFQQLGSRSTAAQV
jgi:hypothetical protein